MKVLIAVVGDLFQFARDGVLGTSGDKDVLSISSTDTTQIVQTQTVTVKNLPPATESKITEEPFRINEQYFIGSIGMYLYTDPVVAFDNTIRVLAYGQQVRLLKLEGRWAQIRVDDTIGWIFKDTLQLQADAVYPTFVEDEEYVATHSTTVKLRACIDDEFGGARGELSLSSAEYVHWLLMKHKRPLPWTSRINRIPGTWQTKLRGVTGVHIGISPSTYCVMEYIIDDVGHVAFVEAVFPDDSIKITQVGQDDNPIYTQEIITTQTYRELRPVFISLI